MWYACAVILNVCNHYAAFRVLFICYLAKLFLINFNFSRSCPVKNLSSQLIHCKLTLRLTASSFWGHSFSSRRTHKLTSHCELAVRPPRVCNSHRELAVSYSWDQSMSSTCSGSSDLTVILLLTSWWDIQVSPVWVWC